MQVIDFKKTTQFQRWLLDEQTLSTLKDAAYSPDLFEKEEEMLLQLYYLTKLMRKCDELRLSSSALFTASVYLKRFLLQSNIKDNDMVAIIGACLLLSSKVEEQRREVDDIAFVVGSKKEDVETSEIVLLTALKFNLVVWHPTRPADGALLDLKFNGIVDEKIKTESIMPKINDLYRIALLTDLPFLMLPSHLGLLLLHYVLLNSHSIDISEFIGNITTVFKISFERAKIILEERIPKQLPNFSANTETKSDLLFMKILEQMDNKRIITLLDKLKASNVRQGQIKIKKE